MSCIPDDTIAAIATAAGGAARGMVRVSGPATATILAQCFVADTNATLPPSGPATAIVGQVRATLDDGPTRLLPCDLFLWPNHRSYTREPVAEFHTLGSPPLLRAVLAAVCRAGARLAEPGEFTLRAFLAGRIDLSQAEAVLGVIDAHGTEELRAALGQLAGNLARPVQRLRDELLTLLADLEAGLDFAEEDVQFIPRDELATRLQVAAAELAAIGEQTSSRLTTNSAGQAVLLGPPNAGKSSLFNALVERFGVADRSATTAIVSEVHGTTRDYLTATLNLDGHLCELIDTAGVEAEVRGRSPIAATAQRLAAERRAQSMVRVHCIDASSSDAIAQLNHLNSISPADLVVLTKSDVAPSPLAQSSDPPMCLPLVSTSSISGQGLGRLASALVSVFASTIAASRAECVAATADRCRDSVRLADAAVARAAEIAARNGGDELVAAEIRVVLAELGKVVGAVYTDDLLDRIFATFCIGK